MTTSMPVSAEQFDRAFALHHEALLRSVGKIVGNTAVAEEIVQETYVRFFEKGDERLPEKHRSFLLRIAHNLAVDYVKKNGRWNNFAEMGALAARTDVAAEVEAKLLRENIVRRLSAENDQLLQVFVFKVDYGLSNREIAEVLDLSERTVFRYLEVIRDLIGGLL